MLAFPAIDIIYSFPEFGLALSRLLVVIGTHLTLMLLIGYCDYITLYQVDCMSLYVYYRFCCELHSSAEYRKKKKRHVN